jgi:hypothetical protein
MNIPPVFKTKKFVAAIVGVIALVAGAYGFNASPEFQQGIIELTCSLVQCVEVAQ